MKVTKITVGKGISQEIAENEWTKEYYSVEVDLEFSQEAEVAKERAVAMVDKWLEHGVVPRPDVVSGPSFDHLPWLTYRSRRPCDSDEPGWTFRDGAGAEDLAKLLDPAGKAWVCVGENWEYKFSGRGLSLINRRLVKKDT